MKFIALSKGYSVKVDCDDYEFLNNWKWFAIVGKSHVYAATWMYWDDYRGDGAIRASMRMHRLLMNPEPSQVVDHINGDTLDNRRSNLRVCSHSQNIINSKNRTNCSSEYRGVYWDKNSKTWAVGIRLAGFNSEVEAARKFDELAKIAFGEFVRPNFGGNK